jgi:erythromycin esterase
MKNMLSLACYFCLLLFIGCSSDKKEDDILISHPNLTLAKLLTDSELVTPELPYALSSDQKYNTWVKDNHYPIRSITFDEDFSDLSFLDSLLEDKKIVQLGESSHGSAEFNHIKVRLIKYLHQELGFDVISFESSLQGCHLANQNMSSYSSGVRCIFGVWRTAEVEALFQYIKATQQTDRPLILSGVDIQNSSQLDSAENYKSYLAPFIVDLQQLEQDFINSLLDDIFTYNDSFSDCYSDNLSDSSDGCIYINDNFATLRDQAAQAHAVMSTISEEAYAQDGNIVDIKIAKRLFWSMQYFIEHLYQQMLNAPAREWVRDEGMAGNASFLMEQVYSEKKMIVWAHNGHIAYGYQDQREGIVSMTSMGMLLKQAWQEQIYTIGLVMIRGESNLNTGVPVSVVQHLSNSFESIVYSLRKAAVFIPLSNEDLSTENDDWQHQLINIQTWGRFALQQKLSNTYDAMIVIDKSSPSQYLLK